MVARSPRRLAVSLVLAVVPLLSCRSESAVAPAATNDVSTALAIEVSSGQLVPAFSPEIHDYELTSFTLLEDVAVTVRGVAAAKVLDDDVTEDEPHVLPRTPIIQGAKIEVTTLGGGAPQRYTIHLPPADLPAFTTTADNPEPGTILLSTFPFLDQTKVPYLLAVSTAGEVLYYRRLDGPATDFKRHLLPDGTTRYSYISSGAVHVLDDKLSPVADYQLLDGARHGPHAADNHDFRMLSDTHVVLLGTITETVTNVPYELGDPTGETLVSASVIQEIQDGQVVFEWDSTEHPELYALSTEGNGFKNARTANQPADYAHVNSLVIDPADGNLIVSFRHLDAVLKIARPGGSILWRLGGPGDTFGTSAAQRSSHQHFASVLPDGRLQMFDNGNAAKASRVLTFGLDVANRAVSSFESVPLGCFGSAMGSVEQVGARSLLVGLGASQPGQPDVIQLDRTTHHHTFELTLTSDDYYSYRAQWLDAPFD
jgi:hypothetical protein